MALDPERKVKPGDRMSIPAATYNSLIDMLREYKRNKGRFGAGVPTSTILPHNTILVQNQTGINLTESFKILRIADVITSVQDNLYAFAKRPAFVGTIPQSENDAICITIDPALVNGIGSGYEVGSGSGATADIVPAVISGITLALVHLVNVDDEWANPTPGSVDYLTSGSSGQARILYWESLTGSFDISGSGSDDVVLAVVNLIGAISAGQSKLLLMDNSTANNTTIDPGIGGSGGQITLTHVTIAGYKLTTDDHVWSEDDSTGLTLVIPANSGDIFFEALAEIQVHLSCTGNSPNFGPTDSKFQVMMSLVDLGTAGSGSILVESEQRYATSGINAPIGTAFYSFVALGGSAVNEASTGTYWKGVVPFKFRLPNLNRDQRFAFKTYTKLRTDSNASGTITMEVGLGPWGKGGTHMIAEGL